MIEADATLELWVMALRPELTERVLGAGGCFLTGPREFGTFGLREQLAGLSELSDGACVEGRIGELFVMLSQQPSLHVLSRRALQLLHSDPASEAGHLAERLGTHPSVLSRRFHRDLGASLVDHRTKVRLLRFIEDVDRGATLIQASLDAGFGSYSQLTRCFRRVIGCTASEYFAGERWELSEQLCVAERPV
jgi:AraC-like DNA-binding protein